MNPHYCDHSRPDENIFKGGYPDLPLFPNLRRLHELVSSITLHSNLGISDGAVKDAKELFEVPSSLDDCRTAFESLLGPEKSLSGMQKKGLEELRGWMLVCISYLATQEETPKRYEVEVRPLPVVRTYKLSDEVMPLLRDASVTYHYCAAKLREENWAEHCMWFLFLLRFCDGDSLVNFGERDREDLYDALLGLHGVEDRKSCLACPPNCLNSFLFCLYRINPGALLEAIAWLGRLAQTQDDFERYQPHEGHQGRDAWLLEDDGLPLDDAKPLKKPSESYVTNLKKCASTISESLFNLNLNGTRLLLNAFGRFGGIERKVLLNLFGIDEHGIEMQDIASSLATLAYNANLGRTSFAAADRLNYFQRAIEVIHDIRLGWSSEQWFSGGARKLAGGGHRTFLSLGETLDAGEEELRVAITGLPISPRHVRDRRWLTETFYFAFLVDHENFWAALVGHIRKTCPDIVAHRSHPQATSSFFQLERPRAGQKEEDLLARVDIDSYKSYVGEHRGLLRFVISKLLRGLKQNCGVSLFDYGEAVAYWRNFPESHPQEFKHRGLDATEPDLHKTVEAADRKISRHMTTKIWEMAHAQGKKPFYIVVSGDSDYLETLYDLRRRGADCQYWLFRSQAPGTGHGSTRLLGLGEERLVWLDDLISGLNEISSTMLFQWRNQYRR